MTNEESKCLLAFIPDAELVKKICTVSKNENVEPSEAIALLIEYGYDALVNKLQANADFERQLEPLIIAIHRMENSLDNLRHKVGDIVEELD